MAVEIKEIVIRAVLADEPSSGFPTASPSAGNEALVQECVNQVLKVLNKKNRR